MTINDKIQLAIAIILSFTLIVLGLNLWAFWRQNKLTQSLNQPLCAIKEVKVAKARDHVIQISVIIKNFGNYVAKGASFDWEIYAIKKYNDDEQLWKKEKEWKPAKKTHLVMLPQHEFENILMFYEKEDFNKMVEGYQGAVGVRLSIEYQDMNNQIKRYSCVYVITRMLPDKDDTYEVTLKENKIE
jgi:hypothetical protein